MSPKFQKDTAREIKAKKYLVKHLGNNHKSCIDDAFNETDGYEIFKEGYREAKYSLLEKTYQVYLHCSANEKAQKYLSKQADAQKIKRTHASHLSIVVVKVLFGFSDKNKSLYQYAKALRGASLEKILPNALAKALAANGNGIARMAARFPEKVPMKPRAPALTSSSAGRKSRHEHSDVADSDNNRSESGDAEGQSWDEEATMDDDDEPANARSAGSERVEQDDADPTLSWLPKLRKTWQSAGAGRQLRVTIVKHGEDDGSIIKARRLSEKVSSKTW